jgi:predicted transcriptional regulator
VFLAAGIALDGALMRLAPGFTEEDSNKIWMLNALLAIIFDLIITDTIRGFATISLYKTLSNTSFVGYILDIHSINAFIESHKVKDAVTNIEAIPAYGPYDHV